MACLQASLTWNTVALTASTAKTVGAIKTAANQCDKVLEVSVSHDGASSTNAPDVTDIAKCTFGGAGTAGSTPTPNKLDYGRGETIQTAGSINYSAEPTTITAIRSINVAQFNGLYHYIVPFAAPIVVAPGGTATGFVVRQNSPNTVNSTGHIEFEE